MPGTVDKGNNQNEHAAEQKSKHRQEVNTENAREGAQNVEWPDREIIKPNYTSTTADELNGDEMVTVYGGSPGEKVRFSVAATDEENYYIDEMRRAWKRASSEGGNDGELAAAGV